MKMQKGEKDRQTVRQREKERKSEGKTIEIACKKKCISVSN